MRRGGGHKARSVSQLLSRDNEAEEVAESGAAATPSPGPTPAAPARSRRSGLKVMAVVAVILAVIVAVVVSATGFLGAQAATPPTHRPSPSAPAADSPSTVLSSSTASQPPATADPSAPGRLVPSGEDRSDPFLYQAGGRYYLYTSGTTTDSIPLLNVPVASSTDLTHWSRPIDAMPSLPAWAAPPFTWAPDVHRFGSTYVLYYTGYLVAFDEQCIGSATSSSPLGPFTAQAHPFICQSDLSGSIDPRVFTDDSGTNWMLWKSDQNAHGRATPTTLWSQRLAPDGLSLVGTPTALMSPDEAWQGTIVEAPDMVEVNGVYWLTYAANWFNQPAYGIGVAWCVGPSGPCADVSPQPLIGSNAQGQGPGEPSFYQDATGVWLLYSPTMYTVGDPNRPVYITRLGFGTSGAYLAAGDPPSALPTAAAGSAP